jgi:hypothetical protein
MSRFSHYIHRLLTQAMPQQDAMPSHYDIERQQKLLAMYRGLLAEYLRQHQQWARTEVPGFLSTGISVLRGHILDTKGTLRGWKIAIDDHPDDQGPDDDVGSEVEHQRTLLKIHRRNLATYLQQAQHFPAGQVPAMVVNSLDHVRGELQRIKAILRGFGVVVDELPGELIAD